MLALRKAITTFKQFEALAGAPRVRLLPAPEPNRADHPYAGTIVYQGLLIYVENPKGSTRSGTAVDGTRWSVKMPAHYGEFAGTLGMDGDPVDVFVGDDPDAPDAFVVHQKVPGTQRPDEDKVILGVRTAAEARALFMTAYTKPGFFGGITRWSLSDLRDHLLEGRAPGTRLDLPPHLADMIKASRSVGMSRLLLKSAQLALFNVPKHPDFVHVPTYTRKDGTVVKEHTRRGRAASPKPRQRAARTSVAPDGQSMLYPAHAAHTKRAAQEVEMQPWQQEKKTTLWYERKNDVPKLGEYVGTKDGPRKVTAIKVDFIRDDAMSFGAPGGMDTAYAAAVTLAPVDPADRAEHEQRVAARQASADRQKAIFDGVREIGAHRVGGTISTHLVPGGTEFELEARDQPYRERRALVRAEDGSWWSLYTSSFYDDPRDDAQVLDADGAKRAAQLVEDLGIKGVAREVAAGTDEKRAAQLDAAEEQARKHAETLARLQREEVAAVPAALAMARDRVPEADLRFADGQWSVRADGFEDLYGFTREGDRMVAPLYDVHSYKGVRSTSGGMSVYRDGTTVPADPAVVTTLQSHITRKAQLAEQARKQAEYEAKLKRDREAADAARAAATGAWNDRASAWAQEMASAYPALDMQYHPPVNEGGAGSLSMAAGVADTPAAGVGYSDAKFRPRSDGRLEMTPRIAGYGTNQTVGVRADELETLKRALIAHRDRPAPAPRIGVSTRIAAEPAAAAVDSDDFGGAYGTGGSVNVSRVGRSWLIRGNTYPIKDALHAHGATWDATEQAWKISHDKAKAAGEKLRKTLHAAPANRPRGSSWR